MGMPRVARFCPMCGGALELRDRFGHQRPVCVVCGHVIFFDPKVAVAVLVIQDERVLLVRRANDPLKGYWALPAGFIEWNEDPQEAARRECLEETGLVVEIDHLVEVFHTPDDGGLADLVIAYSAHVTGGSLGAADDADAVGWFSRADLPSPAFLPSQRLLARWVQGLL
jgi:ADP-ribose pyrophosphatase YjhB (NUDIX family)